MLNNGRIRKKAPMWHALDDSSKVFVNRISFHGRYAFKNGLPLFDVWCGVVWCDSLFESNSFNVRD